MPIRRILPRRLSPSARLQCEIDLQRQVVRKQTLELMDAINGVPTPSPSDDEEEDEVELPPHDPRYAQLLNPALTPTRETSYHELYLYPQYLQLMILKLEKVKKGVLREEFEEVLATEGYREEMALLRETYPEDGGRVDLYKLLALWNFFNNNFLRFLGEDSGAKKDEPAPALPAQ